MLTPRGSCLASLLAMLLAGCAATTPPPPGQTTTALPVEAAIERLAAAAAAEGLAVERRADGLVLRGDNPTFINCPPAMVGGGGGEGTRSVFTQVSERRAVADVTVAEAGGRTQASWRTSFTGRYHNRVNNTFFENDCASTGALEGLLVRALAG